MNRKASLQRKLAMPPVPKPPAGLAERIKSEIPKELLFNVDKERARFSSSVALNMRVAASILILISTLYLAVHIVSRAHDDHQPFGVPASSTHAGFRDAVPAAKPATAPPVAIAQTETMIPPQQTASKKKVMGTIAALEKKEQQRDEPNAVAESTAGGVESGRVADFVSAPAPAGSPAPARESIAVTGRAPLVAAQSAKADAMERRADSARPRGIAVDDEFIQRFAAPASLPPGIALDVEAAEQPLTPGTVVVRASFDCGVVVRALRVDVVLSPEVGASARWLAMTWRYSIPDFANRSRSTLVEFAMPASDAPLATIRAVYRIADDPSEQTIEKVVRRSDVHPWRAASRRTKGGTLAALWRYGAGSAQIASAARAAGLDDLAAEVEKR